VGTLSSPGRNGPAAESMVTQVTKCYSALLSPRDDSTSAKVTEGQEIGEGGDAGAPAQGCCPRILRSFSQVRHCPETRGTLGTLSSQLMTLVDTGFLASTS
jgi:hypothetical protein